LESIACFCSKLALDLLVTDAQIFLGHSDQPLRLRQHLNDLVQDGLLDIVVVNPVRPATLATSWYSAVERYCRRPWFARQMPE
jgi:hypothetical protein